MLMLRFPGLAAGVLVVACLAVGCSSFRHDARAARGKTPAPGSVEGLWEGRWSKADQPEHGGKMQLVLTKTGDNLYRASARSQWWRIFRSAYDTTVVLTPIRPGEYIVQGGKDLWAMGSYTIDGRVNPTNFHARFAVEKHAGVLDLHRPAPPAAQ